MDEMGVQGRVGLVATNKFKYTYFEIENVNPNRPNECHLAVHNTRVTFEWTSGRGAVHAPTTTPQQ